MEQSEIYFICYTKKMDNKRQSFTHAGLKGDCVAVELPFHLLSQVYKCRYENIIDSL